MSRKASFTQADIRRAVAAMKAAGETVTGVDVRPDGSFRVLTGEPANQKALSPYQAWKREHGERAA